MNFRFLGLTLLGCMSSLAGEVDNYVCITDKVTGFNLNDATGEWEHSTFLAGERFLLRATTDDNFKAERLDELRPWTASCRARDDIDEDSFTCNFGTNALHFNRKELRFTAFRYFGFWSGSKDSVAISIGSCNAS